MKETVKWKTDALHHGQFDIVLTATMADKIREAWADHMRKFPDCQLCDLMEIEEDFV